MPDEVFVSGGGALNPVLMRHLKELLAPIRVESSAALGVDPEAKEAISFAVLANQTLFGDPGNIPAVTGAVGPRVLGKLSFSRYHREAISAADALAVNRHLVDPGREARRRVLVGDEADAEVAEHHRQVRAVVAAAVVAGAILDPHLRHLGALEVELVRLVGAVDEPLGAVPVAVEHPVVRALLAELGRAGDLNVVEELVRRCRRRHLHGVDHAERRRADVGVP